VSCSQRLFEALEEVERNVFEHVITGAESWFYIYYSRDSLWAESRDAVPEKTKQKIDTEKCLIYVLWSVNGIHHLIDMLKTMTENADFFRHTVMPSLIADVTTHILTIRDDLRSASAYSSPSTCRIQTWISQRKIDGLQL
jgi:hypothetical protein